MLTKKQQLFLDYIINCYKETKDFPSITTLKKNSPYKSYNTIYKYLNQLEKKGFIKFDFLVKKVTYINEYLENNIFSYIPIINEKETLTISNTFLNKDKSYIAFKIHNNKLNSHCIKNGDILVIEKCLTNLNNKLVLVFIKNKYQVLKYEKKDGFIHLTNDKDFFILPTFEAIVGKVCLSIRDKF